MKHIFYCDSKEFEKITKGKIDSMKIFTAPVIAHVEAVEKNYKPKIIEVTLKERD